MTDMTSEKNVRDVSLSVDDEKEAQLFDELVKLPRENRRRLLEAVRVYELVESHPDVLKAPFPQNIH